MTLPLAFLILACLPPSALGNLGRISSFPYQVALGEPLCSLVACVSWGGRPTEKPQATSERKEGPRWFMKLFALGSLRRISLFASEVALREPLCSLVTCGSREGGSPPKNNRQPVNTEMARRRRRHGWTRLEKLPWAAFQAHGAPFSQGRASRCEKEMLAWTNEEGTWDGIVYSSIADASWVPSVTAPDTN